MQNRLLCAPERLDCAADDILTAGGQDLKPNIVGNNTGGLDQATGEVEICLRGGGERNLDFLVTNLDELLEETELLLSILNRRVSAPKKTQRNNAIYHWIRQTLVAVSQIGGQPPGSLLDNLIGPLTILEFDGLEALVLFRGILEPMDIG